MYGKIPGKSKFFALRHCFLSLPYLTIAPFCPNVYPSFSGCQKSNSPERPEMLGNEKATTSNKIVTSAFWLTLTATVEQLYNQFRKGGEFYHWSDFYASVLISFFSYEPEKASSNRGFCCLGHCSFHSEPWEFYACSTNYLVFDEDLLQIFCFLCFGAWCAEPGMANSSPWFRTRIVIRER